MKRVHKFACGDAQVPGVRYHGTLAETSVQAEESAAQKHLRELAKQQLNTDVSLLQQVKKHKIFEVGSQFVDISHDVRGLKSLGSFKTRSEAVDSASSEGDTSKSDEGQQRTIVKHQSSAEETSGESSFGGAKLLSRHEMDVEMSLKRKTGSSYMDRLVAAGESSYLKHKYPDPKHPMNSITQLTSSISEPVGDEVKVGPKPKPNSWKISASDPTNCSSCQRMRLSDDMASCGVHKLYSVSSCYPHNEWQELQTKNQKPEEPSAVKKTIKADINLPPQDQKLLENCIVLMPEEKIVQNKLSVDEIKKIQRFSDYEPGQPNEILYVKNLSTKTTQADLMSIFFRFPSPNGKKPQVKLMTGRMRGQAFITFPDMETASQALSSVHGFVFNDKPMVILYGKSKSGPT